LGSDNAPGVSEVELVCADARLATRAKQAMIDLSIEISELGVYWGRPPL
jgi:hypothetical protein